MSITVVFKYQPNDFVYIAYPAGIRSYQISQVKYDGVQNLYLIPKLGMKWIYENELYKSVEDLKENISLLEE